MKNCSIITSKGRGRKSSLTPNDESYLKISSIRDRRKTIAILTEELNRSRRHPVSKTTVRKALISFGLVGRVATRKPLLRPAN